MDLYHAAELGYINLDDTITLASGDLDTTFGDLYKEGVGYKLTLRMAAEIALTHSDNTAAHAINTAVGGQT